MNKNYYDILGVSKTASDTEVKKAYKKKALEYHPDRNKGDKKAETKFKEINEAYQTLGDKEKKKNYDQFGSAEANPFGNNQWNPFSWGARTWWRAGGSTDYEDIFSGFGGGARQTGGFQFDIGDLFGGWATRWWSERYNQNHQDEEEKHIEHLDVTKTLEIPFLDFLYGTTLDIETVYSRHLSLKVKPGTKPGTKYKISGKWRTTGGRTGDMFVIVDAKMPRLPLDPTVEKMLDAIRYQI